MIEFFKKLFKPESSGATARERLQLVLLSDHLALAPDIIESLRTDLIAVISRYVEVDEQNCDVTFERRDAVVAMLANVPIRSLRARPPAPPAPPPDPPELAPPAPPPHLDASPAFHIEEPIEPPVEPPSPKPPKPRRRRRRRAATQPATATG
jgi:cell division topological specificity factor